MKSKKLSLETNSLVSIVVMVVILAIVGVISQGFWHARLDLTEDKQFTLSNAAVKTLKNLPDLVTVKVVISSDLPSQFVQIKTHVTDILEEFKARAGGKLELVYEDPGDDEEKKKQVQGLGIQEVQMQEQSTQGLEIKKGFFGLAMTYGDKKEVIPVLNNLQTFEYDLVVKLKKLTGVVKKVVVVEGKAGSQFTVNLPGNPPETTSGFDQNFRSLKQQLQELYNVEVVNLASKNPPEDGQLMIVAAPASLNETEVYRIDQFLMKGGSVIFLAPGVNVNLGQGISATPTNSGIEPLLDHYGLPVKKNIIVEDRHFEFAPFGNSIFPIPYPYWVVVDPSRLHKENAITSKLGKLSLPWTSSIGLDSAEEGVEILAQSSKGSWEETGRFNLFPRDLKEFLPVNQSDQVLAALKTGKFTSYYSDNPLPEDTTQTDTPPVLEMETEGRILVVGNALFATDFYMGLMNATGNLHFMLNAIDQMALDPDLIKIRSKDIASRPIPEDKKNHKLKIVLANMVTAPVILLLLGIFVSLRRRKRDTLS